MGEHRFQVNLRGMIDLLSHHLYSGPQVYVRELLQNAVDAITARQNIDPEHQGEVKFEIVPGKEGGLPTLAVTDNGIGLNEEDVHHFLATIGRSSKRESLNREDFLGQFGIGLLSAFVVSEEIVVITRSARPECADEPAVKWVGRVDGTYTVSVVEGDISPGTQVYLRAKPGCQEFFEPKYVRETGRHFGSMLPFPIDISSEGESWSINETPPWRQEFDDEEERTDALLEYGNAIFETEFFDAIPLRSEAGKVDGVAFVLPQANVSGKRTHRVYLKNMLVSEQAEGLLPEWAFFVKCIVNADDLRPTASRETFYEDDTLLMCRADLGASLKDYLVKLADTDRERLDRLIDLHYLAIKALAVEDDDFYRIFINWLPFETSLGTMTLGEYRRRLEESGRDLIVRYAYTRDEFRQIAPVASAQDICVINAGYTYDRELLEKLPNLDRDSAVERFEIGQLSANFADLAEREKAGTADFIDLADGVLARFGCRAELKKFDPATLPALFTTNEAGHFLRQIEQTQEITDELFGGILDRISEQPREFAGSELCFNFRNPVVRRLTQLPDKDLAERSVEMLYVQALLLGHFPLRAAEMELISEGLLGLIDLGLRNLSGGGDE